jgi:hypothetical protein
MAWRILTHLMIRVLNHFSLKGVAWKFSRLNPGAIPAR